MGLRLRMAGRCGAHRFRLHGLYGPLHQRAAPGLDPRRQRTAVVDVGALFRAHPAGVQCLAAGLRIHLRTIQLLLEVREEDA